MKEALRVEAFREGWEVSLTPTEVWTEGAVGDTPQSGPWAAPSLSWKCPLAFVARWDCPRHLTLWGSVLWGKEALPLPFLTPH